MLIRDILLSCPFITVVCSLFVLPMLCPKLWHKYWMHYILTWLVIYIFLSFVFYDPIEVITSITHVMSDEYIPFVLLLSTLFFLSQCISVHGYILTSGTPLSNTILLLIASFTSSLIGTTGSSLLFIQPLINANKDRVHMSHILVFFIITVSNVGGSLLPIGDPPLFIGYLKGVSFFWTLNMLGPMVTIMACVLLLFYIVDSHFFVKYDIHNVHVQYFKSSSKYSYPIKLIGIKYLFLLLGVIFTVIIVRKIGRGPFAQLIEIGALLSGCWIGYRGMKNNNKPVHMHVIMEVIVVFLVIFITAIHITQMIATASSDSMPITYLFDVQGNMLSGMFFIFTGIFSMLLDNAPTYMIFFNAAGGDANFLMAQYDVLLAISCGSVFAGAFTYLGNAPNLMCRSIAQDSGVEMPTFLMYTLYVTLILAVPIFLIGFFAFDYV